MIWLLRMFMAYRDLESRVGALEGDIRLLRDANGELVSEKAAIEASLQAAQAERQWLTGQLKDALNGERLAYQMQINHAVQRNGGGIPYPAAHSLPSTVTKLQDPGPIGRSGRELPSETAAKATTRELERFINSRGKLNG